jgi:hypothetical protein
VESAEPLVRALVSLRVTRADLDAIDRVAHGNRSAWARHALDELAKSPHAAAIVKELGGHFGEGYDTFLPVAIHADVAQTFSALAQKLHVKLSRLVRAALRHKLHKKLGPRRFR